MFCVLSGRRIGRIPPPDPKAHHASLLDRIQGIGAASDGKAGIDDKEGTI